MHVVVLDIHYYWEAMDKSYNTLKLPIPAVLGRGNEGNGVGKGMGWEKTEVKRGARRGMGQPCAPYLQVLATPMMWSPVPH